MIRQAELCKMFLRLNVVSCFLDSGPMVRTLKPCSSISLIRAGGGGEHD
jgi:hypothetical protein